MSRPRRNRQFPFLTGYLQSRSAAQLRSDATPIGCAVAVLTSALVYVAFFEALGPWRALILTTFVGLPAAGYLSYLYVRWMNSPKSPDAERLAKIREAVSQLRSISARKKLARELDPAAGALLEEAARHWSRIRTSVSGPLWNSKNLPLHWKGVRERSLTAANSAMDELILILQPVVFASPDQSQRWEGVIETIMEAVFDKEQSMPPTHLPPGFEPARQLAESLKQLAGEVERTSVDLAKENMVRGDSGSAAALESCLSELKALREAEAELEQHLEQNG